MSPRHFRPLIRVLERERHVVAPELPLGVSVEAMAAAARRHLRERSVVFANSMGCQAAVELARDGPELVAVLVLVGPTADPAAPTLRQQFRRLALDALREPPSLNRIVATDYLRRGPHRTLISARHMLQHRTLERARDVAVAAVVVRGERDPIVSQEWAATLARALRGDVCVVAGAAHCAHFTHPEVVAALA